MKLADRWCLENMLQSVLQCINQFCALDASWKTGWGVNANEQNGVYATGVKIPISAEQINCGQSLYQCHFLRCSGEHPGQASAHGEGCESHSST